MNLLLLLVGFLLIVGAIVIGLKIIKTVIKIGLIIVALGGYC